jgi:MFS family permease
MTAAQPWWRERPRLRAYALLTAISFMNFLASGITNPLMSIRAQGLGATLVQIGFIGTVSQIAGMAVQYLWGRQSDRLMRRKPLILIGMASTALTTVLIGAISTYEPLYWIRGLNGLAAAAYAVGSLALIGDLLEGLPNRGQLMGLHRGLGSLAFGLSALFGGRIADLYGLGVPFFVAGGFSVLSFVLASFIKELPPKMHAAAPQTPLSPAPAADLEIPWERVRQILPFLVLAFIWSFSMGSAFAFWPVYMVEQGFAKTMVTQLWGIAAIGETAAMVLAGYLSDRFGSRRIVIAGLAGMGCIFMAYTFWPRMPWLIPIQLVRSLAFSCYSAATMLYATEMGLRRQRGRMSGMNNTANSLGGIAGSAAGGGIAQLLGLGPMIRYTGLFMIVGALLVGWKMPEPTSKKEAK